MSEQIPDLNLFMMCDKLNLKAFCELPEGFHIRNCRRNELDIWKAIHFDETPEQYYDYMTQYFNDVYSNEQTLFYDKCLYVCDEMDSPVGTCFIWKAYSEINTLHWYKVVKSYEGKGIGRALLSVVMSSLTENDFPVFLHTQPSSYRAIKLYSDFGFSFLTDSIIGMRKNDLDECLPILKRYMLPNAYDNLKFSKATDCFLKAVNKSNINQF